MKMKVLNRDFTFNVYLKILQTLIDRKYEFFTFEHLLISQELPSKTVVLRHDIDSKPKNALKMAELENELNIRSSYYFRIVNESFNPKIIKQIYQLGHEAGYHYEELTVANGDLKRAIEMFKKNINCFNKICEVKTICMHGSPTSKWNNKDIWNHYDFKDYGIIGDPSFSIDFDKVFYLTDTSRAWNSNNLRVRDCVDSKQVQLDIRNSFHLINLLEKDELPNHLMINTHSQRWNDNYIDWATELFAQSIKNIGKYILKKKRSYEFK